MNWFESLLGNGVVFAIIAGVFKYLSSKSMTKQINEGLAAANLLTETQLTNVLQQNIEIHDKRLFAQQAMTTNNISHMRQAWINDLRTKIAEFLHKAQWVRVEITRIHDAMINEQKISVIPESTRSAIDSATLKKIPEFILEKQKKIDDDIQTLGLINSYIDLLLPFSSENFNKKEPYSDELRQLLEKIMDEFYAISGSSDTRDIEVRLNRILKYIHSSREITKIILLTEWRVTRDMKFFKELEPANDEPSNSAS